LLDHVRASKFLALILRHDPAKVGIVLDDAGWTDIDDLLAALAAHGVPLTRDQLDDIVAASDKQRFAISDDGTQIRANQGHSVPVDLELEPAQPPASLYHGTVEKFIPAIREHGLQKGKRHHVHLSADHDTAVKVGSRRGKPVVLEIDADAMVAAGRTFYRSANGVWLADEVPVEYIEFPGQQWAGANSRAQKVAIAQATLAACDAGFYTNAGGERVELADAIAAARGGTVMYERDLVDRVLPAPRFTTAVSVTGESTIAATRRLADGVHVGCLNFASAKRPGGGFLGGAQAQEETLARSSGLYACLAGQPIYYQRNKDAHSALYLDLVLVSPQVPFFRDDDGDWFDRPVLATVVTAAAPNATALREKRAFDAVALESSLRVRSELVLAASAQHGIERLVLGAWGAGVFGNDPAVVAQIFADLLRGRFAGVFAEVVFAIVGGPGRPNYDAFAAVFAT
jgi:uncharacterized protein (TIGR02452 family)